MKGYSLLIAAAGLALTGCVFTQGDTPLPESVSGGKSAIVVLRNLATTVERARPSATLGVFSSIYLSQGLFFPTQSAPKALTDLLKIIHDQEQPLSDESFALLQTLGDLLTVDIVDMLNRSSQRVESLDRYSESLTNAIQATKRKLEEMKTALDVTSDQKKEQRTTVRDLERAQKSAINDKDFALASEKEQELLKARSTLSETELTEKQTKDMQSRLKKLLEIAEKRKAAIDQNREILLSGLKVTDLPGLTDIGIVETPPKR